MPRRRFRSSDLVGLVSDRALTRARRPVVTVVPPATQVDTSTSPAE